MELGGGGLLDLGTYPIQMACNIFNHEKPINIITTGHLMPSGVDECCTVVLLFPGQRIAQFNISTNCTSESNFTTNLIQFKKRKEKKRVSVSKIYLDWVLN